MSDAFYERQKEIHGAWATIAWIGSGIYLFATTDGAHFLSWQAAAYFIVGSFIASVVFGVAGYAMQNGVVAVLALTLHSTSANAAAIIFTIGIVQCAIETAVTFVVARWILSQML